MTQFVYTTRGYRRLSDIKEVKIADDGKRSLWGEGKEQISEYHNDLDRYIISIIPTSGEWEQVYTLAEDDGMVKVYSEPVIAWGLTTFGTVIPVTPTAPEGLPDGSALRKVGRPEIYVGGMPYENEDSWLRKGGA